MNPMSNDIRDDVQPNNSGDMAANRIAEMQSVVIPVIEEQVHIGKQVVETGRIQVVKTVRQEEATVDLPLTHDEFSVERVAVNQYVETAPAVRYEGDTTIVPVLKEVLVVEKRMMLIEEIRITKRQVTVNEPQRVTLRKEEVTVNRTAADTERPV